MYFFLIRKYIFVIWGSTSLLYLELHKNALDSLVIY